MLFGLETFKINPRALHHDRRLFGILIKIEGEKQITLSHFGCGGKLVLGFSVDGVFVCF